MLSVEQIKKLVTDYFKDKPVSEIYLFGSYARGDAKETSDVDIAIVLNDKRMNYWQYASMAIGLEEILKRKVDLVEVHLLHSWVKRNFEKEKIALYHS